MNPRSRRAALHAIAAVAVLASLNALAHSYIGLYGWATTHGLTGWQAATWPAEIDVFLIIGELALYIAYLDLWPTRHKLWPWATAIVGLAISIAGNVGHVRLTATGSVEADRITAATSPLAAFAGLAIALLVLKLTRSPARTVSLHSTENAESEGEAVTATAILLLAHAASRNAKRTQPSLPFVRPVALSSVGATEQTHPPGQATSNDGRRMFTAHETDVMTGAVDLSRVVPSPGSGQSRLLSDAQVILAGARERGTRLTQRRLAVELRRRGHRVSNANLKHISSAIGLASFPSSGPAPSALADLDSA